MAAACIKKKRIYLNNGSLFLSHMLRLHTKIWLTLERKGIVLLLMIHNSWSAMFSHASLNECLCGNHFVLFSMKTKKLRQHFELYQRDVKTTFFAVAQD